MCSLSTMNEIRSLCFDVDCWRDCYNDSESLTKTSILLTAQIKAEKIKREKSRFVFSSIFYLVKQVYDYMKLMFNWAFSHTLHETRFDTLTLLITHWSLVFWEKKIILENENISLILWRCALWVSYENKIDEITKLNLVGMAIKLIKWS